METSEWEEGLPTPRERESGEWLKRAYQDAIAQAAARGEYERAGALLEEYRQAIPPEEPGDEDGFDRWRRERQRELDRALRGLEDGPAGEGVPPAAEESAG